MFVQLNQFSKRGVDIRQICFKKIFNPFYFVFQLFKYYNLNPDILHSQYGSGNGFLTSLLKAKFKVLSIRGSDWYYHVNQGFVGRIRSYIATRLTYFSLGRYDSIIVMSYRIKAELVNKFPDLEHRISVVTDGIDLDNFYPMDKFEAKSLIGIKNNTFLIGLGSIDSNNSIKNIPLALKSIEIAKKSIPNLEFIFISNVPHQDIFKYLSACDVVLLTSEYEGWPNIIKEALACNTPFVSTDVSDLKLISKRTEFCFVSKPDPLFIAKNIIKLYSKLLVDKPKDLTVIASEFALTSVLDKILNIYKL
ncbi:glycosyltransferase [Sandaracinomonas limnophila]|uniref:Glycosyltransferase n=2 Tax=Sandaracinomonas limnophila TaxID=1862386 RepID=A0A437PUT0_9BACT|nr:glycosyltransferase [Sandaracinomonas limnophila]